MKKEKKKEMSNFSMFGPAGPGAIQIGTPFIPEALMWEIYPTYGLPRWGNIFEYTSRVRNKDTGICEYHDCIMLKDFGNWKQGDKIKVIRPSIVLETPTSRVEEPWKSF